MTITDATHALAAQARQKARVDALSRRPDGHARFIDLAARLEPGWVEAVAVLQAVCAQMRPGQAAPTLDTIRVSASGEVSFMAVAGADEATAVRGVGRLLAEILPRGDCPLSVIEASERASRTPAAVSSAQAFGAALTCLPHAHGPRELAQYVRAAEAAARPVTPNAATSFTSTVRGAVRARLAPVLVAAVGIGAGVTLGALVAAKAIGAPDAPTITLVDDRR